MGKKRNFTANIQPSFKSYKHTEAIRKGDVYTDPDFLAANIKRGVEILGVIGTYGPHGSYQFRNIDFEHALNAGRLDVSDLEELDLTEITINPNIIKAGEELFGVVGTYDPTQQTEE